MRQINYFLLTEGASDRMLEPVINWLFRSKGVKSRSVDSNLLEIPTASKSMADRLMAYCPRLVDVDLLIVHRDSDGETAFERRKAEIVDALSSVPTWKNRSIPIIPIQESEAWLLIDETSIRKAAGAPNANHPIKLPAISRLEKLKNPKEKLEEALKMANPTSGRRSKQFRFPFLRQLVATYIEDYSILRNLSAFQEFELEVDRFLGKPL